MYCHLLSYFSLIRDPADFNLSFYNLMLAGESLHYCENMEFPNTSQYRSLSYLLHY